jgi:glycosyltransferase involved in cell wall biosynthesis
MRVLQVMAGASVGGAETFFVDLVSALQRAGLDQRVAIRRNGARATTLRDVGLEPLELPFGGFFDFATRRSLARFIAETKPDIVQTWMSRATAACPTNSFVHVGWLGGYYDLKYFRNCDELVGVTQDIADHVVKNGWPRERAHYLPTLSFAASMPPLRRADFDTPESVPLILALGRLHSKKGFDVLLKSLADIPGAYLWLAGDGPLEGELKKLSSELGLDSRVRFLGWRNDRAALFASCDLCVMPSRYEPFGTVMIEAWAYDCPIIAAAADGPRALIRNGENGLLVAIDDVAGLTGAIRELLDHPDLAGKLVETARKDYEAGYTEEKVAGRYLDFYQRLLSERGVHAPTTSVGQA